MTDEEMAEEWLDVRYLKDMGVRKPCKEAYLAGLKAGKDMAEADLATIAYMQGATQQKKKSENQLTKAREIINDCVRELQNILSYKIRNKERIASVLDKAEQFLKEE